MAVINNAGPAHLEGFGDLQGVALGEAIELRGLAVAPGELRRVEDQALATELGLIKDGRALSDLMGPELYARAEAMAAMAYRWTAPWPWSECGPAPM